MTARRFLSQNYRHDLHSLLDSVESYDRAEKHPDCVDWCVECLGAIVTKRWLKPLSCVVANVPNGAPGKRNKARALRQDTFTKIITHPLSGQTGKDFRLTVSLHYCLHPTPTNNHFRIGAKEGIARDSFASFN